VPNAAFYRERAAQSQSDADKATLHNVRERHLVARDTWTEMAVKADAVLIGRAKLEVDKAAAQSLLPVT
jgi:hypothetical protein